MLDNKRPNPIGGLLAGAAGGLLAAWIMNEFQTAWSKASESLQAGQENTQDEQKKQDEKSSNDNNEDATMKAAGKIAPLVLGRELAHNEKKKAGPVIHYAFGTLAGGLYGLLAEYLPAARLGFGTLFGTVLFLAADEIAVPAFGLSEKPTETPLSSHLYGLTSHFVYGISTEAVRKGVRRIA